MTALLDSTPCRHREVLQHLRGSCYFHCTPENVLAGPTRLCLYQQRHKSAATNNHESSLLSQIYYVFFVQSSQNQYVHNDGVVCVLFLKSVGFSGASFQVTCVVVHLETQFWDCVRMRATSPTIPQLQRSQNYVPDYSC